MGAGFCVIGLEHVDHTFRSLRPLPPAGHAWIKFPYKRGDVLSFEFTRTLDSRPHVEDRQTSGQPEKQAEISETKLVDCLRRAEKAEHLHEFFGCKMRESILGGKSVWASPREATRSICGCNFENLLFRIRGERIRVALSRAAGDSLESLPLVDRDWHGFILQAGAGIQGANRAQRVEKFLNQTIQGRILDSADRFARVGITRVDENGCCWLMLDSLFPGPRTEWLEELH
jgi:hypothetical protein